MNTPMPIGTYTLFKTSLDSEALHLLTFDFSQTHQILSGSLTVSTATTRVLKAGLASMDLTLSAQAIDSTNKMVQVRITDAGAAVGLQYHLICLAVLSDGTAMVASIVVDVEAA